jgi:hypothetical protein
MALQRTRAARFARIGSPLNARPLGAASRRTGIGRTRAIAMAVALLGLVVGCEARPAVRYELPAGFRGWVEITYEDPHCPALRADSGELVVRLTTNGKACTSSAFTQGWARDRYVAGTDMYRTRGSGGGGMIWGNELVEQRYSGRPRSRRERFFVGTENEYKAAIGSSSVRRSSFNREATDVGGA